MGAFFASGGMGMYPTLVFGFLLVASGILFMLRPEPRYLASLVGLGATTAAAGLLGIPLGTVKSRMHQLVKELREDLRS